MLTSTSTGPKAVFEPRDLSLDLRQVAQIPGHRQALRAGVGDFLQRGREQLRRSDRPPHSRSFAGQGPRYRPAQPATGAQHQSRLSAQAQVHELSFLTLIGLSILARVTDDFVPTG